MGFRFQRLSLLAIILAIVAAYGYFSTTGHREPSEHHPTTPVSIAGSSSVQGPYFSDQDRIAERIISAINHTRHTLDIAVYSMTQPEIAAAIEAAYQRKVQVRIVSDAGQSLDSHSEIEFLKARGIPIRLSGGFRGRRSLMHNKFAVFDGTLVETGSFNWTTSASSYNFENAILIEDPVISKRYEEEFDHIWAQAR